MDPRMIPKGSSQEYNYDESNGGMGQAHEPGVYFHPQAQRFVETANVKRPDGSPVYSQDQGKVQADAFVQMGYRPANEEELREYRARQAEADAKLHKENTSTTTVMSSGGRK